MKDAWYLIANPSAGGGIQFNELNGVLETFDKIGIQHQSAISEAKEHVRYLAEEAIWKGYRNFVAVGGDGTLHDVLNGLMKQKQVPSKELTLTTFPTGTGSDWARMYGISRNIHQAAEIILKGKTISQDIGLISYQHEGKKEISYFINVVGLGYDAFVVQKTQNQVKHGAWAKVVYLLTALRSLNLYKAQHTHMKSDNFEREGTALFSNVGICKYSGGGMRMVPKAQPLDGLFDITFVEDVGMTQVLLNIIKLYNGKLYRFSKASHYRSKSLFIDSKEPIPIEADGELLGHTPANFELLPAAIQIRVPSSYKGQGI